MLGQRPSGSPLSLSQSAFRAQITHTLTPQASYPPPPFLASKRAMSADSSAAAAAASASAAAPQSDSDLLTSMGLNPALALELLSSSEDLIAQYGKDTTVEEFLQRYCHTHIEAMQRYCDSRVAQMQEEGAANIKQIKAQYAQ